MLKNDVVTRRNFLVTGGVVLAGSPLIAQIHPVGGPVKPVGPAVDRLLRQSVVQVYSDLKAQQPNANRLNLLAGHVSVLVASLADDGSLAAAQAQYHPKTAIWTAQDTTTLVANAASFGVKADPAMFSGLDQEVQNQRESFPLQVADGLAGVTNRLLAVAAKVQAMHQQPIVSWGVHTWERQRTVSFPMRPGMRLQTQGCSTFGWSPLIAFIASLFAITGQAYVAALLAAIAAMIRFIDQFAYCDTQLG